MTTKVKTWPVNLTKLDLVETMYLSKKGFKIFGYYRIIFGISLLVIHFFIYSLTTI